MNDDTAEIEANVENAYQAGIRDGRKMERERIAVAIEVEADGCDPNFEPIGFGDQMASSTLRHAARIARTEPS